MTNDPLFHDRMQNMEAKCQKFQKWTHIPKCHLCFTAIMMSRFVHWNTTSEWMSTECVFLHELYSVNPIQVTHFCLSTTQMDICTGIKYKAFVMKWKNGAFVLGLSRYMEKKTGTSGIHSECVHHISVRSLTCFFRGLKEVTERLLPSDRLDWNQKKKKKNYKSCWKSTEYKGDR